MSSQIIHSSLNPSYSAATQDIVNMINNLFNGLIILYYLFHGLLLTLYYICYYLVVVCVTLLILLRLCGIKITPHFGSRSRMCGKPGCGGFKNDKGCYFKSQTEECLKLGGKDVEEVDELPLKELSGEDELDIEFLMSCLEGFAPRNGRALCLFKGKCGCPVAKLQVWGKFLTSNQIIPSSFRAALGLFLYIFQFINFMFS